MKVGEWEVLPEPEARFASPPRSTKSAVTVILDRIQQGDPKAADELLPLVYEELRRLAAHEAAGQTLRPTALFVARNSLKAELQYV